MVKQSIYRGFSTINAVSARSVVVTGIELVKVDLLNTFYTSPGEDRMRPLFGCRLRQMIFEQGTKADQDAIVNEVLAICQADPRVTYQSTTITTSDYGITVAVQLVFNEFAVVDTIIANFNLDASSLYGFSGT